VNPHAGLRGQPELQRGRQPDIEGAKQLLRGVRRDAAVPDQADLPDRLGRREKAFAALKASYDEAGFDVTLDGLDPSGPYYDTIQKPGSDCDLIWGGWGADWPSISTVIPPLFDSRINLTKASNGSGLRQLQERRVNAAIDAARPRPTSTRPTRCGPTSTTLLAEDVAYIPLDVTQFYFLHGSTWRIHQRHRDVGYPDLADIAVKSWTKVSTQLKS
jgi:peptide/nickel transport system substrate-binding protein